VNEGDRLDLIGDKDAKQDKRAIKRVLLHKIVDLNAGKSNSKPLVILVIWKSGLYEEDSYKKI
jgi:hypothetical protein